MMIGIDLGTTHSLAAVWREGRAELIPNALGQTLTPSVVSISDQDDVLVGEPAKARLLTHPKLSAAAFKRYMGSDRQLTLGRRRFRAEELSALVLRALKEDAEHFLGEPVNEAVISVPAYFNDAQRKATRLAGELAGLKVERLINEPTAAALAYGLQQTEGESRFLVFDLGGGTFDVSILELFDGIMEVHASAGDNYLGGEDFVDVLMQNFLQQHNLTQERLSGNEVNLLRNGLEAAKRALNQQPETQVQVQIGKQTLNWVIAQRDYEGWVQPLLERLRAPVERALRDSRLAVSDIDEVVLVGGSTRKLVVQKLVSRMFGRLPLRQINPDEVVALGAAVQAGLKSRDQALKEVVLTDVCPYSLGIETHNDEPGRPSVGMFSPILERNTVIPASRVETYYPTEDFQRVVMLKIYQGESRLVKDNIFLGELQVPLPGKRRDESAVDVRFTYDVNGLLEVEAHVHSSGQTLNLVLEQNAGSLSKAEIAERLAKLSALKIHPRENLENQALVARANRLYEELLGEDRIRVGRIIEHFVNTLEGQDPQQIQRARKALEDWLARVEVRGLT